MVVLELVFFSGVTSGYLISFPFAAFFIGFMVELFWQRLNFIILFVINTVGGIGIVYSFGIPWVAYMTQVSLLTVLISSLGFLVSGFLKVLIASFVALTIKKPFLSFIRKKGQFCTEEQVFSDVCRLKSITEYHFVLSTFLLVFFCIALRGSHTKIECFGTKIHFCFQEKLLNSQLILFYLTGL